MAGASPALCFVVCTSSDREIGVAKSNKQTTSKQPAVNPALLCLLCLSHSRHSVFEYHFRIPQYRQAYKYRLKYGGYMCCAWIGGTLVLI